MKTSGFGLPSTVSGGDKVGIQNSTDQVTQDIRFAGVRTRREKQGMKSWERCTEGGGATGPRTKAVCGWTHACMHGLMGGKTKEGLQNPISYKGSL